MKVLITGTSSGIGQSLAHHFASAGHHVWGLSRSTSKLPNSPDTFRHSPCDISSWSQLTSIKDEVQSDWKHLDALICCAAIQHPMGPAMSINPDDWITNLNINLTGTFLTIRAFHELLLQSEQRAKIICFSGGGATSPRPNITPYAVTKAGVVRLVENLSTEWTEDNIDINAVAPGAVNTRMTQELVDLGPNVVGQKEFQTAKDRLDDQPTETPKFIGLTEFLISQKSNGITGRLISAPWDPWPTLNQHTKELQKSDIFTLRRITPEDRKQSW